MDQESHVEPCTANPKEGQEDNGSWLLAHDGGANKASSLAVVQAASDELAYAEVTEPFPKMLRRLQKQDSTAKLGSFCYATSQAGSGDAADIAPSKGKLGADNHWGLADDLLLHGKGKEQELYMPPGRGRAEVLR